MDQLPRLGKRELICLLLFTCNYEVYDRRCFLFLCVFGMDYVISSPEPKTHRRAYRILMVRRPSVVRPSVVRRLPSVCRPQCSKIFFSETARPIKAKFYVEPPWVGRTKFCSRHLGHMTKMAATPVYGKNLSKFFFSGTVGPISTKHGM